MPERIWWNEFEFAASEEAEREYREQQRIEDALFLELGNRVGYELLYSWENIDGQVAEELLSP
jgi:hypothetical protein